MDSHAWNKQTPHEGTTSHHLTNSLAWTTRRIPLTPRNERITGTGTFPRSGQSEQALWTSLNVRVTENPWTSLHGRTRKEPALCPAQLGTIRGIYGYKRGIYALSERNSKTSTIRKVLENFMDCIEEEQHCMITADFPLGDPASPILFQILIG